MGHKLTLPKRSEGKPNSTLPERSDPPAEVKEKETRPRAETRPEQSHPLFRKV